MWTKVAATNPLTLTVNTEPDGKLPTVHATSATTGSMKVKALATIANGSQHSSPCTPHSFKSTFAVVVVRDASSCDPTSPATMMKHEHHEHQPDHHDDHGDDNHDDNDAPWDEALSFSPTTFSHQQRTVKIPQTLLSSSSPSTEGTLTLDSPTNKPLLSSVQFDQNGSPFPLDSPEATAITTTPTSLSVKSKSKPKKRSKKIENDTVQPGTPTCNEPASIMTEIEDSKDSPREVPNISHKNSTSSSRGKSVSMKALISSKRSLRDLLKDETKPLSFRESKPSRGGRGGGSGDVSPVTSSTNNTKATLTKSKTKGTSPRTTATTGTTKGGLHEPRSNLSSISSLPDQLPDLACSDTSESKDCLVDDHSLGSLTGNSAWMDSVTSLESQTNHLQTKPDGRKSRRSRKQRSESSLVFPSALQTTSASNTLSTLLTGNNCEDRRNGGTLKDRETPETHLVPSHSSLDDVDIHADAEKPQQYTPDLQDLMPPLKRKPSKGNQPESKTNTINASEILKKKIMQMNEVLRLNTFHGNSCSSLQSVNSGDMSSSDQCLSSKSDHGITTRRPHRTLSGNAEKFRQSVRSRETSDNSDATLSTRRRRKSVDGISSRQQQQPRETMDTSNVKEARRRLKFKDKDEEGARTNNKGSSKSPKGNVRARSTSVSRRSLSKLESNTTTSPGPESASVSTDSDAPTTITPHAPLKQGKSKPSSSKKSNAKDGNSKATNNSDHMDSASSGQFPENSSDDSKDSTNLCGKSIKSPKSHRKSKDANSKPSSQTQLLPEKERSHSFSVAEKIDHIQKKEQILRSRSQSPSRKGKRQPKSLLNPETLDAWQISQQQKHRVTPFPAVYCRRLDDDDDDDDDGLNAALLLPPAFRQLQVGQKPKSSGF